MICRASAWVMGDYDEPSGFCGKPATALVGGAPRCAEHTPFIEPLTEARADEIELDALIDDIAETKLHPRRRGGYRRGLGMWLGWDDDEDFGDDELGGWFDGW